MKEYVFVNRRHTAKTLLMLLIWYFGAAFCGVAVFVLFGVAYKAVTGQYMADFHVVLTSVAPVYVAILVIVWVRVFSPRVKAERERATAEFEEEIYKSYYGR
jgi:hypothetical protein